MTDDEARRKLRSLVEEELATGTREWWYLSFAGPKGFLGACIVKAFGPMDAVGTAHKLGINPGGEVLMMKVEAQDWVRPEMTDRLLSVADMETLDMEPRRYKGDE